MAAAPHLYSHRAPASRCAWESLMYMSAYTGWRGLAWRGMHVWGRVGVRERGQWPLGHHMAASWPSTILNCCVLLVRSLTRSTMSLEAEGDG